MMKSSVVGWWSWVKARPTVLINLIGLLVIIVGGSAYISYQLTRSLDVLKNWTVSVSDAREYRTVNGQRMAVFNPGESLVFVSSSVKVVDTAGDISRRVVCEAVGKFPEREIHIDTIPASRPAGSNPPRENAVTVPDVSKFRGLPRVCRLVINITYENVALWRNYAEQAQSEQFIVEEPVLDPAEIRKQIDDLNSRIVQLEKKLEEGGL